jgi:hypothetical protein
VALPLPGRQAQRADLLDGGEGRRDGRLLEPLSSSEARVLRYLPTNLTVPEIARELSVSPARLACSRRLASDDWHHQRHPHLAEQCCLNACRGEFHPN